MRDNPSILSSKEPLDPLEMVVTKIYEELRSLAHRLMGAQRSDHTLQATALVHEAYLRLARSPSPPSESRKHFVGIAAKAMRSVLVDHARMQKAEKRGGDRGRRPLSDTVLAAPHAPDIEALDGALGRLEGIAERKARVVELRYFAGLSLEETACVLRVSVPTVKRDWAMAKAWLHREIREGEGVDAK